VTLANAVGNGVADDKAIYPHVPKLIRYYLNEEPILPNVETYNLQDPDVLAHVKANLAEMVVKPVAGSGGYGLVIGPQATKKELSDISNVISENPRGWIAQPVVNLSTCPTVLADGEVAPRHIDLRPFAVNDGNEIWVLPGGLTRVALVEGSLVVNSSQGGGSKDTWVLADGSEAKRSKKREPKATADESEVIEVPVLADREVGPEVLTSTRLKQQEEQQQQELRSPC
jgi:uncharacterized circularly permuted ATP-grasp superfamily protein